MPRDYTSAALQVAIVIESVCLPRRYRSFFPIDREFGVLRSEVAARPGKIKLLTALIVVVHDCPDFESVEAENSDMATRFTAVSRAYTPFSLLNLTLLLFSARVFTGAAPLARAQAVSNAKMHGVITAATGAVVPNAAVIATQTESAQTFTTVSSSSGEWCLRCEDHRARVSDLQSHGTAVAGFK